MKDSKRQQKEKTPYQILRNSWEGSKNKREKERERERYREGYKERERKIGLAI